MKYVNAESLLPEELLTELRKYMPEGYLYISPKRERKEWGSISGQKEELKKRNLQIYKEYKAGKSVEQISEERYLSISSVYRIIKDAQCA